MQQINITTCGEKKGNDTCVLESERERKKGRERRRKGERNTFIYVEYRSLNAL